jgi:hypothetical protein
LIIGLVVLGVIACDQRSTTAPSQLLGTLKPGFVFDPGTSGQGCWPISSTCHDRELEGFEVSRGGSALSAYYHNTWGDADCGRIINLAFERLYNGGARFWTDPPDTLTSGDSHRTLNPQIMHITQNAWGKGDLEIAKTLIHEASHLLGFNHPTAYFFEDTCM